MFGHVVSFLSTTCPWPRAEAGFPRTLVLKQRLKSVSEEEVGVGSARYCLAGLYSDFALVFSSPVEQSDFVEQLFSAVVFVPPV